MGRARALLFAAVATCAVLGILEGVARIAESLGPDAYDPYPGSPVVMDPVLHHRLRPNVRMPPNERASGHVNAQGWDEVSDVPREKPPHTYRIFYVGDSQVQGMVPTDKKMVEIVERELNRQYQPLGTTIEVINTGTSSYSIMIYYLLVRHVLLDYAPDLVVLNVDMTDVANDYSYRGSAVLDASGTLIALDPAAESSVTMTPFGPVERSFADRVRAVVTRHSAFARRIEQWLKSMLPAPPPPTLRELAAQVRDRSADWLAHDWSPLVQRNVETSMQYLGMTIDLLKRHGVRVVVTGVPHHPQFTGEFSARPHTVLAETAARHGCLYLDTYAALAPHLRGTPQSRYYWDNDPTHFNERGNAVWAQVQLRFLLAHRDTLLPEMRAAPASGGLDDR